MRRDPSHPPLRGESDAKKAVDEMSHTANCERATTYTCVCPCGGAMHGAVLIRGISSADTAAQTEARGWAEPRRWGRLPAASKKSTVDDKVADRHPAMTGIVSELVLVLMTHVRKEGEIDAIELLAGQISQEVGDEFERHLGGGGPDRRSNRHLWCVVLATICRLYDQGFSVFEEAADDAVHAIMQELREDVSASRSSDTSAQDIYQYRHRVVAAFNLDAYPFLEQLTKKAVLSLVAAVKEIGEDAVMKHLRLFGVITCPDPDRHPDVVKHCLWPLLDGPFRALLEESVAAEMRTWLRNGYVVVPTT